MTETARRALLEIGYPSKEWVQSDIQKIKWIARDGLAGESELLDRFKELHKAASEALPLLEALANPHSLSQGQEDEEITALRAALDRSKEVIA